MRTRLRIWSTAAAIALSWLPQRLSEPPRLIVLIVVDQFRGDYPEMYGAQWTKGLRRLWNDGAVFPEAAYSFGRTTTCGGHATISTGTLPATHGVIDNSWLDRATEQNVNCSQDPAGKSITVGGVDLGAIGPAQLHAVTLGERLTAERSRSQVVVISQKARSAVMLAGHGSRNTLAVWSEESGTWGTSSVYGVDRWSTVVDYVKAHPIAATYSTWTRLLSPDVYRYADDAPGEINPRVFPHPMRSPAEWLRSPSSDAYVGDLALGLVDKLRLGQGDATDLLALGFSALDFVGHDYGPHSHEVQDILVRLDATIGRLLDGLDQIVGASRYVIALSSDHGVSALPEQGATLGIDAGRIGASDIRQTIEKALAAAFGGGPYVAGVYGSNVYVVKNAATRLGSSAEARLAVTTALERLPAVQKVYWRAELVPQTPTDDAILASLRRSYYAERSADLIVVPKPNWLFRADDADHGTPHRYDTHVPIVFFGAGIKPGRYAGAATPADIAPTLAALAGITLPGADGRVLSEVLVR